MKRLLYIFLLLAITVNAFAIGCADAINVEAGSECNYNQYTLGTSAGQVCSSDCGWVNYGYKEVWLQTTMPESGRISVRTQGHYINGYIALYSGTCENFKPIICSNNGRLPENIDNSTVKPGETIFIRLALSSEYTSVGVCLLALKKITETTCSGSTVAADDCVDATLIQSPKGYCGNTSASFTADWPNGAFCGSIENNSWLKFVAEEESAELNIHVSNCQRSIGIQMIIYETDDLFHFTPKSNCWNPAIETDGVIEATNLTPGKSYYLMIDGYAGDVCDYVISAGRGIALPQTYIEETICKGERYTQNGFDVSEQGMYRQNLIGPSGKDSTVVLSLTVLEPVKTTLNASIFECERYKKNGFDVNTAGTHYLYLKSATGCDSIVKLNLSVNPYTEYTTLFDAIYACERYTKYGFDVNTEGKHYLYHKATIGCDSIVELNLTVLPNKTSSIDATICSGETYNQNGFNESVAGTYKKTFQTSLGCDSIVTLNLKVVDGLDLSINGNQDICSGESTTLYASGGATYIWQDASGNEIGRGDSIKVNPNSTTSYKLYSKNQYEEPVLEEKCSASDYKQVTIGTQTWMAENYRCSKYDTESEAYNASWLTNNTVPTSNDAVYTSYYTDATDKTKWYSIGYDEHLSDEQISELGYLYSWAAAVGVPDGQQTTAFTGNRQGICPNGWHLPSKSEWDTLTACIGGKAGAGEKLRTTSGWYQNGNGTDDYSFSVLPAGLANGNSVSNVGNFTNIWTSSLCENYGNRSYCVYIRHESGFQFVPNYMYCGQSVRCIKNEEEKTVTDICGNTYPIVTIGSQTWMAENYACHKYDTKSEAYNASWLTNNTVPTSKFAVYTPFYTDARDKSMWDDLEYADNLTSEQIAKLGYLYNWAAVVGVEIGKNQKFAPTLTRQGICPNGWHVPSYSEWDTLNAYLVKDLNDKGKSLKTTSGWYEDGNGTDSYGFAALPAGISYGESIGKVGYCLYFWITTPRQDNGADYAYLRYDSNYLGFGGTNSNYGYSVRCIKD